MIETLPDGRSRVRVFVPGTRKKRTVGIYLTRPEAEEKEAACKTAKRLDGGETIATFGDRLLTNRMLSGKVRDHRNDWSRFKHHVLTDEVALVPIRELRRRDIVAFVERLEAKKSARTKAPLGHQTKQNVLNVLRVIASSAIDKELISADPFLEISVTPDKTTGEVWRYARPEVQAGLLEEAEGQERRVLAVAMYSGLRAGELACLRLTDVVVDGDEPHLVVRYGTPPDLPTKGGRPRTVPLMGQALTAMRAWLAGELAAWCPKNPHGLVFPLQGGTFRDPDHILPWVRWKDIREAAKVQPGFRWHDLRHTCGTSLACGWWGRRWSTEEIQRVLGHQDPKTTARYAKVADDAIASAAREMREAVDGVPAECPPPLHEAARAIAEMLRRFVTLERSRLRDLNSRPAVYETAPDEWLRELAGKSGAFGALLTSVEARDEGGADVALERLALGVLWRKETRLALEVLAGGPFAVHRGLELGKLVGVAMGAAADEVRA